MDLRGIIRLYNTIRFLKLRQVYFRLFYFVRNRWFSVKNFKEFHRSTEQLNWGSCEILYEKYFLENGKFQFLNLQHRFNNPIDWNFDAFGKLWTYNLNYFDFLHQENITKEKGLELIRDYISQENGLKDGLEPYPISLRGINWIKFLSKNNISDPEIDQILFKHYQMLLNNLEYHLLGNHLLENGFALFFGAYYFQDDAIYQKAKAILKAELEEQVLEDGAHFELSPMYHQILLHRLLDCINLARLNDWKSDEMLKFLEEKAIKMLSWLQTTTFSNDTVPMVNDCAYGIAPSSNKLFHYAKELGLEWKKGILTSSGYRKFEKSSFEIFMDVGNVGPDYQPGHAHSDTFNFEMYLDGKPIIVDTGTSTYEKNELRQQERGTASHNTVKVAGEEQTEVWGGFRVAKRAKIITLEEAEYLLTASHNGYGRIVHQRQFDFLGDVLIIGDTIKNYGGKCEAFLHFHPSVGAIELGQDYVRLPGPALEIRFEGLILNVKKVPCEIAMGFNKRESSNKLAVVFQRTLQTTISRIEA